MNAWALLFVFLAQAYDYETPARIAIEHEGRIKPFETFCREFLHFLTGVEEYREGGFSNPQPTLAVIDLLARPNHFRGRPLFKMAHPEAKQKLNLNAERNFFTYDELDAVGEILGKLAQQFSAKKDKNSMERAIVELDAKLHAYEQLQDLRNLRIIPVPVGEMQLWPSLWDLKQCLANDLSGMPYLRPMKAQLDSLAQDRLQRILGAWQELVRAYGDQRPEEFNRQARELSSLLVALPSKPIETSTYDTEIRYSRVKPFSKASLLYGIAAVLFVAAMIHSARLTWFGAVLGLSGGIGVHAYGLVLRTLYSGHVPWSNMYEAMLLLAGAGAVVSLILELIFRDRLFGLVAALLGGSMLMLANSVEAFNPFSAELMPALKSFWIKIHTPCIITGYACGAIFTAIGHAYLLTYLLTPWREETLERFDRYLYRTLQLTVLFVLGGVILGAIWAGEAWGRYWGWDMKENWALATLLTYLAVLHARMKGAIGGFGTAVASLFGVMIVFLTFYGVNFVFGKGLHTYGFGAGSMTAIVAFFSFEGLLLAISLATFYIRSRRIA